MTVEDGENKAVPPAAAAPPAAATPAAPVVEEEDSDDDAPEIGEEELAYDDSAQPEGVYTVKQITENFWIIRWKITHFSEKPLRHYSENFDVGSCPWRLLLFPKGNQQDKEISVYLDCPDAPTQRINWTRYSEFRLGVVNQKDMRKSRFQEARKRFNKQEPDWGFRQFLPIAKLNEQEGYLVNDTLIVEARIEVKKDQFSGWAYYGYDCRKETGFVGLRNQGATCYMNSLLQTLYHVPHFRRAVYHMEMPEMEDNSRNIPLALQRLFWQLQFSPDAVSTKLLTKSFGWGAMDAFVQHDVQELLRVLTDNLEEKMKHTPLEGTMSTMFGGRMKNYIKCVNVDFESGREEEYYDISLVVKDCKNIIDSFDKYTEEETLEGDNQYEAEGFGKQDAKKGVKFLSFPPVLMLQLKRFEYNFEFDNMYKINDHYEFPIDMNLDQYLADDAERTVPNDYSLLSILVHSGDVSGGHYYAYVRPNLGDKWLKFDDERVTPASEKEAVEDNFGGEEEPEHEKPVKNFGYPNWDVPVGHVRRFQSLFKRYANAYMLVYVRRSDVHKYMMPIEPDEIPERLRMRFEHEQEEESVRKREKQEAHLFVTVKIARDETLKAIKGFGLLHEDDETVPSVRVKKAATLGEFKAEVETLWGIPAARQRLWKFINRTNQTFRPEQLIRSLDDTPVETAFTLAGHLYAPERVAIFVEDLGEAGAAADSPGSTLTMLKFYDPAKEELSYLGHANLHVADTLGEAVSQTAARLAGLPEDTKFLIYEEKYTSVLLRAPELTVRDASLFSGDILVFQLAPPPADVERPHLTDYFNYIVNRCTVKVCKLDTPKEVAFTLELMKNMTYNDVVSAIGEQIKHPAENIRLTAHSTYLDAPRQSAIKTVDARTLRDMLFFANAWSDTLYYEALDSAVADIENKKEVTLRFFNQHVEEEQKVKMVVPRNASINVLLQEFARKVATATGQLRLLETFNGKVQKIFKPSESVEWLHEYGHIILRVEEVPAEELPENREDGDRVVQVQHFCKDHITTRCFGNPFYLRVSAADTFATVKQRIKAKLGAEDEEFEKWRFAVLYFQRPEYVKDEDNVIAKMRAVETYKLEAAIGMEHKDTTPRTGSTGTYSSWRHKETPIKIYN